MRMPRSSGILLHPTSLPSPWGVGDLGPAAHRFVDLISGAGQSIWQMLPLTPVGAHGSPYSPHSLFGGNPLLLSPELLVEEGYLAEVPAKPSDADSGTVDYPAAIAFKSALVERAFAFSFPKARREAAFSGFCERNATWLDDFSLYEALTKVYGRPWQQWPEALRRRERAALEGARSTLGPFEERARFSQFLFDAQWNSLREYAGSRGVRILGDVPFYVLHDSADIWAHPDLFKVDAEGNSLFVGGVPPDYFSKTGQRWGNPVYDWGRMEETGYGWWQARARRGLSLADALRLDHFRGYVAYWEIPSRSPTAVDGHWVRVPESFLSFLKNAFPDLPFVAEDLGVITDDVREALNRLGIPGMRVLQFAFDGHEDNPHLPRNHAPNSMVCTGTHDTNTTLGWFLQEASQKNREALDAFIGRRVTAESVCRDFIDAAMSSASEMCIVPFQDVLGLGAEARMNDPGRSGGNWRWRATPEALSEESFRLLREEATSTGRSAG